MSEFRCFDILTYLKEGDSKHVATLAGSCFIEVLMHSSPQALHPACPAVVCLRVCIIPYILQLKQEVLL